MSRVQITRSPALPKPPRSPPVTAPYTSVSPSPVRIPAWLKRSRSVPETEVGAGVRAPSAAEDEGIPTTTSGQDAGAGTAADCVVACHARQPVVEGAADHVLAAAHDVDPGAGRVLGARDAQIDGDARGGAGVGHSIGPGRPVQHVTGGVTADHVGEGIADSRDPAARSGSGPPPRPAG